MDNYSKKTSGLYATLGQTYAKRRNTFNKKYNFYNYRLVIGESEMPTAIQPGCNLYNEDLCV